MMGQVDAGGSDDSFGVTTMGGELDSGGSEGDGGGGGEDSGGFWSFLPDAEPGDPNRPTATQLVGAEYGLSDQHQEEMDEQVGIDRESDAAEAAGPRGDTSPEWMQDAGDDFEQNVEDAVPGTEQLRMAGIAVAGLLVVVVMFVALYLLRPVLTIFASVVN